MCSVSIAVDGAAVVFDGTEARHKPAAEIVVLGDAGVHNIDSHADARFGADITAIEREGALIDSIQAPWCRCEGDRCVFFDKLHACVASERLRVDVIDLDSQAFQAASI